jgi:hypothetical protein
MIKQIKSHWYYVFWGICTVAVLSGQVYIGNGYHSMSNSVNNLIEKIK